MTYDVAIIGAGIVGCSCAFALAKRGLTTINIDALPAAGYGSTSASSAIVRPMYTHPVSACVAHESRFIWQTWRDFTGLAPTEPVAEYRECGGIMLVREGELDSHQAMMDSMRHAGVTFEVIEATDLSARFPGVSLEGYGPPRPMNDPGFGMPTTGKISHGILVQEVGYVSDAQLAARNLSQAAESLGAVFQYNRKVTGITQVNDVFELATSQGAITATKLINASGPHSARVNTLAGVTLEIETRPLRHEVAYLSNDVSHFSESICVIMDTDAGVYQRPDSADMLIGTTDPECDEEDVTDPDEINMNLTDKWTRQVMRAAQRFPEYRIPNQARGTVGVYDVSPDWIPIYDQTDLPGYYVAIGTSGNQFKNGPLIGEIMAEIVLAEDHDNQPAKLMLDHIGRPVDLGFFSRNRQVQATRGVLA